MGALSSFGEVDRSGHAAIKHGLADALACVQAGLALALKVLRGHGAGVAVAARGLAGVQALGQALRPAQAHIASFMCAMQAVRRYWPFEADGRKRP